MKAGLEPRCSTSRRSVADAFSAPTDGFGVGAALCIAGARVAFALLRDRPAAAAVTP